MTFDELCESVLTQPRHICDKQTSDHAELLPPQRASNGEEVDDSGLYEIEAQPEWRILVNDWATVVYFCPWCGEKLPLEQSRDKS